MVSPLPAAKAKLRNGCLLIISRLIRAIKRSYNYLTLGIHTPTLILAFLFDPWYLKQRLKNQIPIDTDTGVSGLGDCDVYVINLDSRVDRLSAVSREFKNLRIENWTRFSAIPEAFGALGCAKSHLALLSNSSTNGNLLVVCEDDLEFLAPRKEIDQVIEEFNQNSQLDVLCLAYNLSSRRRATNISPALRITDRTRTTACYILKPHVVPSFIEVFRESVLQLERRKNEQLDAIDVRWLELQNKYIFAIPTRRLVRQRESYSDITKRLENYGV